MTAKRRAFKSGLALLPVVALAAPFLQTRTALADCVPSGPDYICSGIDNDGLVTGGGVDVSVLSGAIVNTAPTGTAIDLGTGPSLLTNDGTILGSGTTGSINGVLSDTGMLTVNNNGVISGASSSTANSYGPITTGIRSFGDITVDNGGTIDASAIWNTSGNPTASGSIQTLGILASGSVAGSSDSPITANMTATANATNIAVLAATTAGIVSNNGLSFDNTSTLSATNSISLASGNIASVGAASAAIVNNGADITANALNHITASNDIDLTTVNSGAVSATSYAIFNQSGTMTVGVMDGLVSSMNVDAVMGTGAVAIFTSGVQDSGSNLTIDQLSNVAVTSNVSLSTGTVANILNTVVGINGSAVVDLGSVNNLYTTGSVIAESGTSDAQVNLFVTGIKSGGNAIVFNNGNFYVAAAAHSYPAAPSSTISSAYGVDSGGTLYFVNTGSVTVSASAEIAGSPGSAYSVAVDVSAQGDAQIFNYGTMSASGDTQAGDPKTSAVVASLYTGTGFIYNEGTMSASSDDLATAIYAFGMSSLTVINHGTISANGTRTSDAIFVSSGGSNYVYTDGAILGSVTFSTGEDTMIIASGPVTGVMNGGSINGIDYNDDGANYDELTFAINVPEKYYDQIMAEFAALDPEHGTITIQGNTYTWKNFEGLINLLKREKTSFQDRRINPWDFNQTITGWCVDGDNPGYSFWNIHHNSQGSPIGSVSDVAINAALEKAAASGKPVMIIQKDGKSVWALPTHELQLHDGTGNYNYIWLPTLCGSHVEQ